MGPITILDKSAFQSFSHREHRYFVRYFLENVTPVLVQEVTADLSKAAKDGKPSEEKVVELARKFHGSGTSANENYRSLCMSSLMGVDVPMDGRIPVDNGTLLRNEDGSTGMFIDMSFFNHLIMKLAANQADEHDRAFARRWREATSNFSLQGLTKYLSSRHIILPKSANTDEIKLSVDTMLAKSSLQHIWLEAILLLLKVDPSQATQVRVRWSHEETFMKAFAPFAYHCLRALLMLFVASRDAHVKAKPTDLVDLQYLYYLPFCYVFSSDDKVHRILAPLLIRPDQTFVRAPELKSALRELAGYFDARTEQERTWISYALGSHPPPLPNNLVSQLWRKHMRPWGRGMRNFASKLSEQESEAALQYVEELFKASAAPPPEADPAKRTA
ncbi:hypothetical protein HUA78_44250 [Myxococcus sp. CA033]|uniref:hypothetical protein n=1 Tax=Myxococcus sp. CA033 TaxID=2741516 RepID=UPI00157A2F9E|nr:hypothetical protein [Myxococcus sp. CA033]NTX41464.1 hypothetical protein [Myxococcus sp. CA033]